MRLRSWSPEPADVPRYWPLVRDGSLCGPAERDRVLGLWQHVLASRCGEAVILESEGDLPASSRPVGFGISAFVTDRFAEHLRSRRPPCVVRQVLDWAGEGASPLVDRAALEAGNAGEGLTAVMLHPVAVAEDLGEREADAVSQRMVEAIVDAHRGYRLKEFMAEAGGRRGVEVGMRMGLRLRADPGDDPPVLLGITRDEGQLAPGTFAFALFSYSEPRLALTPSEQDLLRRALGGRTDEDLARDLGRAVATVKKRWAGIYARVDALEPGLPGVSSEGRGASPGRGVERRRRLVQYAREHPEELRPTLRPRSRPRG